MTRLCVPIMVESVEQARREVAHAAEAGADMVELRIDRLTDPSYARNVVAECILPCVVTCRPEWEGGESVLKEDDRLALIREASMWRDDAWADVEMTSFDYQGQMPDQRLIVSAHDFGGRFSDFHALVERMAGSHADAMKLAWRARSIRDNVEAFELLRARHKPTIALCMGEDGLLSRVLAKKFGAMLTFASLDAHHATAAGQLTLSQMKALRWDAIGPDTRVFGVVADPVAHSMSPPAHNAAFNATGYDGVYLPMRVDGSYESFKAFMETVVRYAPLQVRGLSITLPHKEHAIWYLQEHDATIEPLAQRIGAVNTIDVHEDGTLAGRNTDYLAILDPLKAEVGELVNTRVAVLGAGGTGRTAVAALASEGAEVVVLNRTGNRAQQLAAEFAPLARERGGDVSVADWDTRNDGSFGIIVNATTLGMFPNVETSPLSDNARLGSTTVVFDCVYNPIETRLIRQARESGAKVIDGVQMFVRQAAAQFEGWTGLPAPVDAIRKEVEARLLKAAE